MLGIDFKQYKWFNHIWVKETASATEREVLKAYRSLMSYLLNDKDAPIQTRFNMMIEIDQEHSNIMNKLAVLVKNEERQQSGLLALEVEGSDNFEETTANTNGQTHRQTSRRYEQNASMAL